VIKTFKVEGAIQAIEYIESYDLVAIAHNEIITLFVNQGDNFRRIKELKGHSDKIRGIMFDEERDVLYSVGKDPDIKVWDMNNLVFKEEILTMKKGNMSQGMCKIGLE